MPTKWPAMEWEGADVWPMAAAPHAEVDTGRGPRAAAVVGAVIALGAIGGVVLGLVSTLWGRTPAGNAALVVPFAGGPAVLAAGWAILALSLSQGAHRRRLLAAAVLEGAAALILALGVVFAPAIGFVR